MVYCTVCLNNTRKNKDLSFFSYPRDTDRREEWLKIVGREDLRLKLYNARQRQKFRICEIHFEKSCFSKTTPTKNLFKNSYPTLNLTTNGGADSSRTYTSTHDSFTEVKQEKCTDDITFNSSETFTFEQQNSCRVQADPCKPPRETEVTQTPRSLIRSKLSLESQERKRFDLNSVSKRDFLRLCDKHVTRGMSQIIKWQIGLPAGSSGNRYSQGFKLFALHLHYAGPATYNFFKNTFCLPSSVILQKLVRPIGTELNERFLYNLKTKVDKMGSQERICSICVGSTSVKANLFYDIKNDRIVGFHEVNGIQNKEPANYAIVVMVRGIVHNWTQPIAHSFLSHSKNYQEVDDWIDEIITVLLNIGLDIRVFISNVGSDFLSTSMTRAVSTDKTYFELNGRKIYRMFNVPHLFKCMRNNLITYDFIYDNKVAKWSHVRELYNEDQKQLTKLAPHLTDIHISPDKCQKIILKLATQVLNRTIASAINKYVDLNLIEKGARDTADFINKIHKLFDLFNTSKSEDLNKNKTAFSGDDVEIEFLEEMLIFFRELKIIKNEEKEVTDLVNFAFGFQVSIKSLLQLHADFKSEEIEFRATKRLNLDCIQNFFQKIKKASGNNKAATCRQLSIAFNNLFVTSILRKPLKLNCDFDTLLKNPDDYRNFNASQIAIPNSIMLSVATTDYKFDLPESNRLVYVSCYLFRKCLERHKCEKVMSINRSEQPTYVKSDSNANNVKSSDASIFLSIPPYDFMIFVQLLEHKFRVYFGKEINDINIGNSILKSLKNCKSGMPCQCFPLDYLKKLYIRFRLYHSIREHNKLLNNIDYKHEIFRVRNL